MLLSFSLKASIALVLSFQQPILAQLDRTGWKVTADSQQSWNPATNVLDGTNSIWHTRWDPTTDALPHNITLNMTAPHDISALSYLPRQDGNANGRIGKFVVDLSLDGQIWNLSVASGNWVDDDVLKRAVFPNQKAQYVRLRALTEAGNRGQWSSAAEINIFPPADLSKGLWSAPFDLPLVAAAAAVLPTTGNVLLWSSQYADHFGGGTGNTLTATYNPSTGAVTPLSSSNTGHDMFCPGISLDPNGNPVVTGGSDSKKTSIYNATSGGWTQGPEMIISRGYQSQTTLSNGNIFTIGGSWSGSKNVLKNGEIYNGTWRTLDGCLVSPMLTQDSDSPSDNPNWRRDNHGWLFGWKDGSVFQAGPSRAMNWYGTTTAGGSQVGAGLRQSDNHAMNGNAIMYDALAGKILTVGGAPNYEDKDGSNPRTTATTNANIITINATGAQADVESVSHMESERAFHNSVVLPDGSVFVNGGMKYPKPFVDPVSAMAPEIWDSNLKVFKTMNPMSIPRNYHSVSLLLPDATVFNAGGGLCVDRPCIVNHLDAEIFSPPYLFQPNGSPAGRPIIQSVSSESIAVGQSLRINATISTNKEVKGFSLIRFASATHSVNTDQRRVPLSIKDQTGSQYTVQIPPDSGIALPGYWMLFAVDTAGVPSVAKTIKIRVS